MENAYAQALWKMLQKGLPAGRQGMKPKEAVQALRNLLTRLGRQSLLPKIAHAFEKIAERNRARNDVVLSVAREKDARAAEKEVRALLADMNLRSVATRIDDSLIGGWRLEGQEKLVDTSFKKYLLSLYNRATRS